MRSIHLAPLAACLFALSACDDDPARPVPLGEPDRAPAPADEPPSDEAALQGQFADAAASHCGAGGCLLAGVERRPLADGVVEYRAQIRVGEGLHDVIGLHRVTREAAPFRPAPAEKAVFAVHGDGWGFTPVFLAGGDAGPSAALELARRGVDVWGIDRRWVGVPGDVADTSFMGAWNFTTHLGDLRLSLALARTLRALGGSPGGPLALLGFSRGAALAYAYAGQESQLAPSKRHVGALVPVDYAFKFGPQDAALAQAACLRHQLAQAAFDAGQYAEDFGIQAVLGGLALAAPDAPSGEPGLTNRQLSLFIGSSLHLILGEASFTPFYHLVGGTFDAEGSPSGLGFSDEAAFFNLQLGASPLQSIGDSLDGDGIACGAVDSPHDDHLGDITLPVLYVGAAGGFSDPGLYTVGLLGGADKTSLVVRQKAPGDEALDYGHQDLWLGRDAPALVWGPIGDWLLAH
jgi:hypothetical protein